MKKVLSIMSILLLTISLNAQEMCGFDSLYNNLINDPVQKESFDLMNNLVTKYVNEHQTQTFAVDADYIIPVVVHLIEAYPGALGISYNQIVSQIDALNIAFNSQYTAYNGQANGATNTRIQFCLASQTWDASAGTPQGAIPWSPLGAGIMQYTDAVLTNHSSTPSGANGQDALINLVNDYASNPPYGNKFPYDKYLNIYVVNNINGGALLSYTPTPIDPLLNNTTNVFLDGVVVRADVFGDNTHPTLGGGFSLFSPSTGQSYYKDEGKVLAHEVGHYLFLLHTFQFGCSGTNDFLNDTDPCLQGTWSCSPPPSNGCNSNPFNQWDNFMYYSEDPCQRDFTNDQKLRMEGFIQTDNRRTLIVSHANHIDVGLIATGCVDPLLTAEFTINPLNACINSLVTFQTPTGIGYTALQWSWDFGDGNTLPFSATNNLVSHTYLSSGPYTVVLTANDGSLQVTEQLQLYVSDCNQIESSQGNWYFGDYCAIDFSNGTPSPNNSAAVPMTILQYEGSVSVSDDLGNLLFYSDGVNVWDNTHTLVNPSNPLPGSVSNTQYICVPNPGNQNQYFFFIPPVLGSNGLFYYAIIDVAASVTVSAPIQITLPTGTSTTSEQITAIPHCNGLDYWIIVSATNIQRQFYVYRLSPQGLTNANLTTQKPDIYPTTGNFITGGGLGQLKASPDGTRLALVSEMVTFYGFSVYNFDNTTGEITNEVVLENFVTYYGCSFSPNSQVLYATSGNRMYQYDLSNNSSNMTIMPDNITGLQLGPDNRIYSSVILGPYLMSIDDPNNVSNPAYNNFAVDFAPVSPIILTWYGLPSFIDATQPPVNPSFTYTQTSCPTVDFQVDECWADYNLLWNFGDGVGTSTLPNPTYTYTSTGTFNVLLTLSLGTFSQTITQSVGASTGAPLTVNGSTTVCNDGNVYFYDIPLVAGFTNNWTVTGGTFDNGTTSFTGTTTSINWGSSGGTITINSSNGGCNIVTVVNITVTQPPVLASSFTSDNCNSCDGTATVNISSGTGPFTYYWDDNSNQTTPTATNLCAGTYHVVVTDGNGCPATIPVTVDATCTPTVCTQKPNITLPNGATSTFVSIPNGSLVEVQGLFTIDNLATYTNVKFRMATGAQIDIKSNNSLTLDGCYLFSCTKLWKEITVNQKADLVVQNYTIIEDAEKAIHWITGGAVTINSSIFNRNGTGLHLESPFPGTIATNVVVSNTIFTCRNFPSSLYLTSFSLASFVALKNDLYNDNLSLYPYGSLIAPAPVNTRSTYGVYTNEVSATIGVSGSAKNRNLFDYLDFGVYVLTNADMNIVNNSFANLSGYSIKGTMKGVGVFAKTKPGFNMNIGGNNTKDGNYFKNCYRGANITDYRNINFINNSITNTNTSTIFNNSLPQIGHIGLAVFSTLTQSNIMLNYVINNNTIDNNATGIYINSLYTKIDGHNIQITSNNLDVTGTSTYCNQGIWMQSLPGSQVITGQVFVAYNTVRNSSINALLFENVNNRLQIDINTELSVAYNLKQSKQVIRLNSCEKAIVSNNYTITTTNNTIIPTGNISSDFITGIYLNNCQSSLLSCNTVNYVDACVQYDQTNSNSQFSTNIMNKAQYGLVLTNAGIIGQQGDATHPSGNEWGRNDANNITQFHTYTFSTPGANISSPLYCKSNIGPPNCSGGPLFKTFPCSNGSSPAGQQYQLFFGLNNATGPAPGCTMKPGNPKANALALLQEATNGNGSAVDKFLQKRQAFHLIKTDLTGVLLADPTLNTFYQQEQSQNIGKISTTSDLIVTTDYVTAKNTMNSLTPTNVAESNFKIAYNVWIDRLLDSNYVLNTTDSMQLVTIADMCLQEGGDATIMARTLLASFTQNAVNYVDCIDFPSGGTAIRTSETSSFDEKTIESFGVTQKVEINLFPNPNNGSFRVTHNLPLENNVYLELMDITGKIVHLEMLTSGNQQEVNTKQLNTGLYFVNFISDLGELMYSTKMSITHE
jgi:PKD repeat protein